MGTTFYRGQQLGRNDLNIFLVNAANVPVNAAEISYALYDFTTGAEVLVGVPARIPANPSVGEYFASIIVPLDANLGGYRIRWTFREIIGGSVQQVVQEFDVIDKAGLSTASASMITGGALNPTISELDMMARLRILLRDNNPDRNYHFRPPAHEETVQQFSRVFGYIWEDVELQEYLLRSLDMISAAPPRTPFMSIDQMVAFRPEWRTLLLTGAMVHAIQALRLNWIADEFDYSIGGVSLTLEKSSKYEGAMQSASDQFDKQLEKAKATVNVIKGLQQPRFGMGIRSAFGPFVGRGVLSPRKFVGF
jgi:hypothetical protein